MARANKAAAKPKKKTVRAAPRIMRGAKLKEPSWEGYEEWTGEEVHKFRRFTSTWYYENFKPDDLYGDVYEWMKNEGTYTDEQIKWAKNAPKSALSVTAGIVARMDMQGAPRDCTVEAEHWLSLAGTSGHLKSSIEFLEKRIYNAVEQGKGKIEEKVAEENSKSNVRVLTIQERIREQSVAACEKIDLWLDEWVDDPKKFDPNKFDFAKHFAVMKITQAHARMIASMYQPELEEMREYASPPKLSKNATEMEQDYALQLQEAYAHVNKADAKKFITALDRLVGACDVIVESSKATRKPRKRKVYSADKLVAKMKYAKTDDKYHLASINPEDIIKANELWVFNTKTRKIGKYVAEIVDPLGAGREGSGLSIKGTTITGFKETESIQKTLRKPEEQLKEFKASGKVKLRTFLDDIKAVDIKLNGRINNDIILLKVQ